MPKIMLDLFKEEPNPCNPRNSLISGPQRIKTVRYCTETILNLGPKIWSIIPNKRRESSL